MLSLQGVASDDAKEFHVDIQTDYGLGQQAQAIKGRIVEALFKSDKDSSEETNNSPMKEDSPECPDRDSAIQASPDHRSVDINL